MLFSNVMCLLEEILTLWKKNSKYTWHFTVSPTDSMWFFFQRT